jgi:hypothetical protein
MVSGFNAAKLDILCSASEGGSDYCGNFFLSEPAGVFYKRA